MEIKQKEILGRGVRFSVEKEGKEVGRARLYMLHNDLNKEPFGLLEDLFVDSNSRGDGVGGELLGKVIEQAKKEKCYKLIATSRHKRENVHEMYKKLGFESWGLEFRLNF